MSLHTYPLERYSALIKSAISFRKAFNEMEDVRLEIHEDSLSLKILNSRNQELEWHRIDSQMQCWQKKLAELWFKVICRSQIKRFKVAFKTEDHCKTIVAIISKLGIEVKQPPKVASSGQEQQSTQAFLQEDTQMVPSQECTNMSQTSVQDLSQSLLPESPLNLSPFCYSQNDTPFKDWKESPVRDDELASQNLEVAHSIVSETSPPLEAVNSCQSSILPDIGFPGINAEDLLVEKILAKRRVDGTLQYLIKWSGISKEFATWKDYSSSWALEDQQKALVFEKFLLDEIVVDDEEAIPYVVDLDLIK